MRNKLWQKNMLGCHGFALKVLSIESNSRLLTSQNLREQGKCSQLGKEREEEERRGKKRKGEERRGKEGENERSASLTMYLRNQISEPPAKIGNRKGGPRDEKGWVWGSGWGAGKTEGVHMWPGH